MQSRKAFTIIELLVVMIIIGILASIAAPMMMQIKNKVIIGEAMAGLGSLRTAMRSYYMQYGAYPAAATTILTGIPQATLNVLQINPNDFIGRYFKQYSGTSGYAIITLTSNTYQLRCYVRLSSTYRFMDLADEKTLLQSGKTTGYIQMDQDGNITQSFLVGTGY